MAAGTSFIYDTSVIRTLSLDKIEIVPDPITGKYYAQGNFQDAMNSIFADLTAGRKITLSTGQEVDLQSIGGAMLLQGEITRIETEQALTNAIPDTAIKFVNKAMTLL
jgi:hypothetical protein